MSAFKESSQVDCVYFDISKAFDNVNQATFGKVGGLWYLWTIITVAEKLFE